MMHQNCYIHINEACAQTMPNGALDLSLRSSADLVSIAEQSERVAVSRYKVGVGKY